MKFKELSLYATDKTWQHNLEDGPFFQGEVPRRKVPHQSEWIDFLGIPLASPIGVPAGPLLDSKWIKLAAKLGFDLLTYKTIRSHANPCHPLPNIVPVRVERQLAFCMSGSVEVAEDISGFSKDCIGITNSFGNPSMDPVFLRDDLVKSQAALRRGQALIVSIFGSPMSGRDTLADFVKTACFAKECGAKLIEANYSCPNVAAGGSLFCCDTQVFKFSLNITKAIKDTPLIIKLGLFDSQENLKQVLIAAAKAGVRAVCGINTISKTVLNEKGQYALGPKRPTSGICGAPIRKAAQRFTRWARKIIDQEKLDLKLMATGGITTKEHFQQFLNDGADIVMSATGMLFDPYLAMKFHEQKELQCQAH